MRSIDLQKPSDEIGSDNCMRLGGVLDTETLQREPTNNNSESRAAFSMPCGFPTKCVMKRGEIHITGLVAEY